MKRITTLICMSVASLSLLAEVKHISSTQELDAIRKSGKHALVKVGTKSCGPCQQMAPLFAQVSNHKDHQDVIFVEFDVTDNDQAQSDMRDRYQAEGWPVTLSFDKQGNHVPPVERGAILNAGEIDGIVRVLKGEMKWMEVPADENGNPIMPGSAAPGACPAPAPQAHAAAPQAPAHHAAPAAQPKKAAAPAHVTPPGSNKQVAKKGTKRSAPAAKPANSSQPKARRTVKRYRKK